MLIGRKNELETLRAVLDSANLCEMKCTAAPFEITDDYDRRLRQKRETYREKTGTRNAIHLTMVSAGGVRRNANWNDIQSEVTLDDLFAF